MCEGKVLMDNNTVVASEKFHGNFWKNVVKVQNTIIPTGSTVYFSDRF